MLKFLKRRKKRVVKHEMINDDPEEDPHNNTLLREWGTNTDNSALSSPSDESSEEKVNRLQDAVTVPRQSQSGDVDQSPGQEKQDTKEQQQSPERSGSGVLNTLPCSQYPGPSSAEECPEEEKNAAKSEKRLANHIHSRTEEACPSKPDRDHPKMDRLCQTSVQVPKRRSHSLEPGVIKRQDQQPSEPLETFPRGRPSPPQARQFSQWSVKSPDVKPSRADHKSPKPQIILSDTPSRAETPRKNILLASAPLERKSGTPDQSVHSEDPYISGRAFPPYWGSFWYPPPPSHPSSPWYMNHRPPWEQPGPQTSTPMWTPGVLPFTFPVPNNVVTLNPSLEKEERSFIGSVKSPEPGTKIIQRKEVSVWRKDKEGKFTKEMEEVKTEGSLKQDETINDVKVEHKPLRKERKSRSPSPVVGIIDFYNLENISDENASNVTVTSSDEEDETLEDEITKLLEKVRQKRKELRSRKRSKSPAKSTNSTKLKSSLKKSSRNIEPVNDKEESSDEEDIEEEEEVCVVSVKEERRPVRKRVKPPEQEQERPHECQCPQPQPMTVKCQYGPQLPEPDRLDLAGVQQLYEELEEERTIADDLRMRLQELSEQAADMDGVNKTLVEEINSLHKGMEHMMMSKTKLEKSMIYLKQEMEMQRCQHCGQSLSMCQCQSVSVVSKEPKSEDKKNLNKKLWSLRNESEAIDNKWDNLEMEIQLLHHERAEVEKEREALARGKMALTKQQHRLNEEHSVLQQEMQKIETERLTLDLQAENLRRLRRELKRREKTLEKVNNMQVFWGNQLEHLENDVQRQIDRDTVQDLEVDQEEQYLYPRRCRSRSWIRSHSSQKHCVRPSKGRSRSYPGFGPRSRPDDGHPSTPQIVHASCCRFLGRSPEGYDDVVLEVESKELLLSDSEEAEVRDERHRQRHRCRPKNRHARIQSRSPANRNYDKVSGSRAELVHEAQRSSTYHRDKRPRLTTLRSSTETQYEEAPDEPLEDLDDSPDNGSLECPQKVKNKTEGYQTPLLTQLMEKVKQLEEERVQLLRESDHLKRIVNGTGQLWKEHDDNRVSTALRTNSLKGWSSSRNYLELSSLAYSQDNPQGQGYRQVALADLDHAPKPYTERGKRRVWNDDDGDEFAADADVDDDDDGGGEDDRSNLHSGAQAVFAKQEAYFRYPGYAIGRVTPAQVSRGSVEGHHELPGKGRASIRDLQIHYQATRGYLQSGGRKVSNKQTTPPRIMSDLPEKFQRNKSIEKAENGLKENSSGFTVTDRPNRSLSSWSPSGSIVDKHHSGSPSQTQQVSGVKCGCKCPPRDEHRHSHPDPRCPCVHRAHQHRSYPSTSLDSTHEGSQMMQERPARNQQSPQASQSLSEGVPPTDSDVSHLPLEHSAAPTQSRREFAGQATPFAAYAYDRTTRRVPSTSFSRETTGMDVATPPTERNNSKIPQSDAGTTTFGDETNCCQVLGHFLLERETSRVSANLEQLHRVHHKKTEKMRQQIKKLKARQKRLLRKMKERCMRLMSKELRGRDAQLAEERHSQDQLKQAVVELQQQLSDMERELMKATFARSSLLQEANSGREHLVEQLKKMQEVVTNVKNEKQHVLKKLGTALEENASLKAQLGEAKKGSQLFEGQAVRLRKKLITYRELAELCHNKYKSQKEQTEQVHKELEDVSKRKDRSCAELLGSEGTVGYLRKHLLVARHRARKRKREAEGLKVERDKIQSERQQEIEASARLEKEKKETEGKLQAETLRYQQLLQEVQSQRQRLSCVATKMQALDPGILQRQMEVRFSTEMGLVLKQVSSFLEHSVASSEAAALADQERQFRNRANENAIAAFVRRYEHLTALKEAAEMEARLLNELGNRNRSVGSWPETTAFVDFVDIRRESSPPAWLGQDGTSPCHVSWLGEGRTSNSPPLFRSAHLTCPQPRMNIFVSSPQRDCLCQDLRNGARFPIRQQQSSWTSSDRNRDNWTTAEQSWDKWSSPDRDRSTWTSPDRGRGSRTSPDRGRDSWVSSDRDQIPLQSFIDPLAGQSKMMNNISENELPTTRQSSEEKDHLDTGSFREWSSYMLSSDNPCANTHVPLDKHSATPLDNATVTTRGVQEVHAEKSSLFVSSEKFSLHTSPVPTDQTERKTFIADSGLGGWSSKGGVSTSTHSLSNATSEVRSPSVAFRPSTGYAEMPRGSLIRADIADLNDSYSVSSKVKNTPSVAVDCSSDSVDLHSSPVDGFLPAKYLTRQPAPTEDDPPSE